METRVAAVFALALLFGYEGTAQAQNLGDLFRKVTPSVVVIRARGREVSSAGVTRFSEIGSGVMVSTDGKVMTAAHVVNAMDEITVEAVGGEKVSARVIASEPAADLSLLQMDRVPPSMTSASMADSSKVRVGDQVMIIGAPYGLSHSMSVGWISARWPPNTAYRNMPLAEFFQTTATINTGNSGGPMFNIAGEVIGIVSHNISKSGGSEGLGFVVTMNTAKKLLLERASFWSGIDGTMLAGELAAIFNVPDPPGFLVRTVAKGSSAWDMGLLGSDTLATINGQQIAVGGDIILSVDGLPIGPAGNIDRIRDDLAAKPAGSPFTMKVLRAGKVIELSGKTQ